MTDKITKTDTEWQNDLSSDQYQVLRCSATERPGSSPLLHEHRDGTFMCAGCGEPLFDSQTKYESGSGWPSFYRSKDGAVAEKEDRTHGMVRVEAMCAKCGGHLGHVFPDGPNPTGLRYCMNGLSLKFEPEKK